MECGEQEGRRLGWGRELECLPCLGREIPGYQKNMKKIHIIFFEVRWNRTRKKWPCLSPSLLVSLPSPPTLLPRHLVVFLFLLRSLSLPFIFLLPFPSSSCSSFPLPFSLLRSFSLPLPPSPHPSAASRAGARTFASRCDNLSDTIYYADIISEGALISVIYILYVFIFYLIIRYAVI